MEESMLENSYYIIQNIYTLILIISAVFAVLVAVILKLSGFVELLRRVGMVGARKISIAADIDAFESLRRDILSAKFIKKKNINQIDAGHLSDVSKCNVVLVDYASIQEAGLRTILSKMQPDAGLIIYAKIPHRLPDDLMRKVCDSPYTIVANFRGRLVNDVLVALMTTPVKKG